MTAPRVVVTGMGVVSPLALAREPHLRRLLAGESAVTATPETALFRAGCALEARIQGFDRREMIANRMLRKLLTTSAAFAVVAAGEALRDAALAPTSEPLADCGLFAGSVCIDFNPEMFIPALRESLDTTGALNISRFAKRGIQLIDPLFIVKTLPNGGVGGIAIEYQVTGPSLNITNGTISGLQAVLSASRAIRSGEVEFALAGAYDSMLSMDSIAEHVVAGRLARDASAPGRACRPFDLRSEGYALGEGAAFFVLESEAHARQRSARVYAEILGGGQSTSPSGAGGEGRGGLIDAARGALAAAACAPEQVDVVFGDGLAIEADDLLEAEASRLLLGERSIPYTAATGNVGFTGATSGALSLMHAVAGLHSGVVPPVLNCDQPDPRCALAFVRQAQKLAPKRALVWNSDRGVKNVAVLAGAFSS